jgi:ribosomal protein L18E
MGSINALTRQGYTLSRLQELVKPNDTIVVTGRLKKEGGSIEVFPLQIDNKAGGRIFPAR